MDNLYISTLYDYYGKLLTAKQQEYFEDYYFANLTQEEIASNRCVSKNLVSKTLKIIIKKLEGYEEILKLEENNKKINQLIADLPDDIKNKINDLI